MNKMNRAKERRWKKSKKNPSNILVSLWEHDAGFINEIIAKSSFEQLKTSQSKHLRRKLKRGFLRIRDAERKGDNIHIDYGR